MLEHGSSCEAQLRLNFLSTEIRIRSISDRYVKWRAPSLIYTPVFRIMGVQIKRSLLLDDRNNNRTVLSDLAGPRCADAAGESGPTHNTGR